MDGGVEIGAVAGDRGGGHPVGGEIYFAEVADLRGREIREGFADGEAGGRGGVVDGDGCAFAHRHRLAGIDVEARGGDGAVSDGDLPRADHLVAADEAAERAVADGDEKGFVGDGGVREDAVDGFAQHGGRGSGGRRCLTEIGTAGRDARRYVERGEIERVLRAGERGIGASHARRFAEEHVEGEVDGTVVEMRVFEDELFRLGGLADDGEGAALAFAEFRKRREMRGGDGEDVTLLRFVAPNLERGHAGLVVGEGAELEFSAASAVVDEFGEGVGNAAGADVVDKRNRVFVAEGPAAVDDFLAATLHLGVVALDAGEIEILVAGAARHRAGGAAAEADEHRGSAEDDELVAGVDRAFLDVLGLDVAEAAGEHDGLVVAAEFGAARVGDFLLEGAEVAVDRRAAEFVVERGAAERTLDHDVEGGDDAAGFAVVFFPRLDRAGNFQIGNAEADEAGLRFRAAAGGAFVADFAAGAGGGTGERGDRGRVIVRFNFAEDVDFLLVGGVFIRARVDVEAATAGAGEDGGVVLVGGEDAFAVERVGVLDHLEQRAVLRLAVDVPGGVENFVAAVLGVRLRKHHQLDVVRVAGERGEGLDEIVDFVVGESEAEGTVCGDEGGAALGEDRDARHWAWLLVAEKHVARGEFGEDDLRHAVAQLR